MKIEGIFEIVSEALLSIRYDGDQYEDEKVDTFELCFKQWQDVSYLENFFESHKEDLQSDLWGRIEVVDAVKQTLNEAQQFIDDILYYAKKGKTDSSNNLDSIIFQPLHREDINIFVKKLKHMAQIVVIHC